MDRCRPDTTLLAVAGMTPAILTETAWAMAKETPAAVPSRVVAITTLAGRERIRAELLEGGQWEALRRALKLGRSGGLEFGDTGLHMRVIVRGPHELADIRTREDSEAAADFILDVVRGFVENPDTRVVAAISGGRKTMGALLYAAMSLIGRETDRVVHVLADEELEQRRDKRFYFPRTAAEARKLHMAEIPFVPLRNRFSDLGRMPGGFSAMVRQCTRSLSESDGPADVSLDVVRRMVSVNGVSIRLGPRAFGMLRFMIEVNLHDRIPVSLYASIKPLRAFLGREGLWVPAEEQQDCVELRRALSEIRRALRAAGEAWGPGQRRDVLRLPAFRLSNG
jgi:CRISPR-associated protein (TIGR02584 family)